MNRTRVIRIVTVSTLVMSVIIVPDVRAASVLNIDVGAVLSADPAAQGAPASGLRFYAPSLNVAKGSTVNFIFKGFHTATLLPANTDVEAWTQDNAGGHEKPWSDIILDLDDTAADGSTADKPSLKGNPRVAFPTGAGTCSTVENPCSYDGTSVVNSGFPFAPNYSYAVTIDAAVGDTVWIIAFPHAHMRLRMTVVDPAAATTTQSEVDSYRDAAVAEDAEEAVALHHRLLSSQTKHMTADGKVVWDAFAGVETHGLALHGMYPRKLRIREEETVRWHFPRIYDEHSVTFPLSDALELASGQLVPSCDPDGDSGTTPDNPPDLPGPPFCSDPSQVEFDVSPRFEYEQGNGVYRGGDFENSGVRGPNIPDLRPYDLRFRSRSSREGFAYVCLIHPETMRGRVVVR